MCSIAVKQLPSRTGGAVARVTVEDRRLDDLDLPAPAFIKCDVEEAEVDVFRGRRETLERAMPTILFETYSPAAQAFGHDALDARRALPARYSAHVVSGDGSLSPLNGAHYANILAVPTE